MGKFIDLTGKRFGRLTVIRREESNRPGMTMWLCECDCGGTKITESRSLKNGKASSCGCFHKEALRKTNKKKTIHGQTHTRLYSIWRGIKKRCDCENNTGYKNYGARGIKLCKAWYDFSKFYDWAISNGYKDDLTIDRINTNGDYCPENCRWATVIEQARNKRSSRFLTYNGETRTIAEWSTITGIKVGTLQGRIQTGWSDEDALTIPAWGKRRVTRA